MSSAHIHLLSRGGQASASRAAQWAPPPAHRPPSAATVRPSRRSGGCGVVAVIPMLGANGRRAPPDLASFLLKERIVYLVSNAERGCPLPADATTHARSLALACSLSVAHPPAPLTILPAFHQGMALVPSVTELLVAEMLYLQYDQPTKVNFLHARSGSRRSACTPHTHAPPYPPTQPIYLYINSAGVSKGGGKLGFEAEALAIYDTMCHVKPPVSRKKELRVRPSNLHQPSIRLSLMFCSSPSLSSPQVRTLCVGTAYGEAAILLAAGEKGTRAALPSASIQLRQPMQRFAQMQASDVDIYRQELRKTKAKLFGLLAQHTGKTTQMLEVDVARPKYLNPYEAVNYGVIDRVLAPGVVPGIKGVGRDADTAAAAGEVTKEMVMRSSYSTGLFDEEEA